MAMQRDPGSSDLSPRAMADRLKEEGKQRLERGKSTAADQVDSVANALKSAGRQLGGQSALGGYTNRLAENIERLGARLRHGSIEELTGDIQAAARRNPTLFIVGGLALGVVLARLVRASAPEGDTYEGEYDDLTAGRSASGDYPSEDFGTTPNSTRDTFGG